MIFRNWVLQNFPFLEDDFDALTDYELFCKMVEYMKKAVEQLKVYDAKFVDFNNRLSTIEQFINTLDLQDEVNNKLDEMYENGQLQSLIEEFIELQVTFTYNTVAEMKASTNLVSGSFVKTNGYYSYNDGGEAYYKVRNVTNDDVIDEKFIIALADEYLVAELQYNNVLNYLQLGGKIDDNTFDATNLIQDMIDVLSTKTTGKIYLPKGKIYVAGTITLKSNVEIIGFSDYATWNGNAQVYENKGTVIYHVPELSSNLFEVDNTNLSVGFTPNICLSNLYIIGGEYSNIGIKYTKVARSILKNLVVQKFAVDIKISDNMLCEFNNCYFQQASDKCCEIVTGSTTCYFNDCYFGQNGDYANGYVLYINNNSCINANFVNCCFETSYKGLYLDTDNVINFVNIYTENIPISGTVPTIKIGDTAPTGVKYGQYNFTGGIIQGTNYDIETNMCIFDVNYCDALNVSGSQICRSNKILDFDTTNSKSIFFNGINEVQIQVNLSNHLGYKNLTYINCNATSTTMKQNTYFPAIKLDKPSLTFENSWSNYTGLTKIQKQGNQIMFDLGCSAGTVTANTQIMTLPSGYRPNVPVVLPVCDLSYGEFSGNYLLILSNGQVLVVGNNFTSSRVYTGSCQFNIFED